MKVAAMNYTTCYKSDKIMTEIIKIQIRVEIKYDESDPNNRKEAIEKAKDNAIGKIYGYPISVKPLTSKLVK